MTPIQTPKMKLIPFALSALSLIFAIGCASEAEKQERKENAYDVSGAYKASTSSDSEVGLSFEIKNESGRHDILIQLDRLEPYTTKEAKFLEASGIDAQQVFDHFGSSLTLGAGYNPDHVVGGENVSKDFGESSQFFVCTSPYEYDERSKITYCLSGVVHKDGESLKGALQLRLTQTTKAVVDGEEVTKVSINQTELEYKSNANLAFHKQYLGSWTGPFYTSGGSFDMSQLQGLTIEPAPDSNYKMKLTDINVLEHQGETYAYDASLSQMNVDEVKSADYPTIQSVYRGPENKRIVVFGQIWSLGDFTGVVFLVDEASEQELATFRLNKQ